MPFDFGYPVHALWFWLSCLCPLAILFMPFDFGYPVHALWFSCSQRLFNYLAFKYFDFVQKTGKPKPKGMNRIDKIKGHEQDSQNQRA
jgi:hypothetical protein